MANFVQLMMRDYEEFEKPIHGTAKGTIPDWIDGSIFRNGGGRYNIGDTSYKHLFDGMALVQKFRIKDGTATYHRRFIRSGAYERNVAAERIVVSTFGTIATPDPCKSLYQRFLTYFFPGDEGKDNCLVNTFPIKDSLIAATETNLVRQIDPETLETLPRSDYTDYVSVHSATAHPHHDPDGTFYNIGMGAEKGPIYKVVAIPPASRTEGKTIEKPLEGARIVGSVPSRWKWNPGYMHSFCMSENYFILLEQPLCMNVPKFLTRKIRRVPAAECLQWYDKFPTKFLVIDRKTGKQVNPEYSYVADKLMMLHQGNAFEEDGHLILDVCGGDSGQILSDLSVSDDQKFVEMFGRRYVLPLNLDKDTKVGVNLVKLEDTTATAVLQHDKSVKCTFDLLSDSSFDFPTINYDYNTKKYRYLYGLGFGNLIRTNPKDKFTMWLLKIDLVTREVLKWEEDGCYPNEGVFIAAPDGVDEDDGVIISSVMNEEKEDSSFLLVLDAKTFKELGRVEFKTTIPKDFHGCFLTPDRVTGLQNSD